MKDPRPGLVAIPLGDVLMAAFAMFSLKYSSLLAFDKSRGDPNFRRIYCAGRVSSDGLREILDGVDPAEIRPLFTDVFRYLQRGKGLEPFVYWDNVYLLSLDGTEYFSSDKIHCASCLEQHPRSGRITYLHSAAGAVIVHPDHREVIPLCPEPILRQDGHTKNDCERNATRRLLLLLMLAFLVDQTQQIACPWFRAALAKINCRQRLWERMRALFFDFAFASMAALHETIVRDHVRLKPVLLPFDTS